jgi:hypothetical protein
MTPKHCAALAVAAVVSAVAAIAVYSSSVNWSTADRSGEALFAGLPSQVDEVAEIDVAQGKKKITLERDGETWVLADHESFPASMDKVDTLLAGLSKAQLVEAKTQKADRYALLSVEDPAAKGAKSHLVRLLDKDGDEVAAVIVGNKRYDTSGLGTSGTYVRKPDDQQAWLANASVDAGVEFADWVNPQLFEAQKEDVKRLTVRVPGEEPVEIERAKDKPGHTLANIPDGMKLKYVNVVDEIVRAARTINFSDVRKLQDQPDDETVSTVIMELEGGLKATYRIRQEDGVTWVSLEASGKGNAGKIADALMARAKGWEFRVPQSQVEEILKRRKDLLEKVSS